MSYATVEEIRSAGRNITAIQEATNVELGLWSDEAVIIINSFCNQDFTYEDDVTKVLTLYRGETTTYAMLPKALMGEFTVLVDDDEVSDYFYTYNSSTYTLDYDGDLSYNSPDTISIRGTWGYEETPAAVKTVFLRLVLRLAIRSSEEDMIHMNSGYTNETTGDGYSYSLDNGTLRSLLRPEDFVLLWPYVNHGIVVA